MIAPRSSPISSLVPGYNPPKATASSPRQNGSLVLMLHLCQPAPMVTPSRLQDLPQLAPSAWGRGGLRGLVWHDCFRFGHFLMGVEDLILSLDVFDEED